MTRAPWSNCASMLPNGSSNNLQTQAAATKTVPKQGRGRSTGTMHRFQQLQMSEPVHGSTCASISSNGSAKNLQPQETAANTVLKQGRGRSVGTVHRFAHLRLRLTCLCTPLAPTVACSVTSHIRMPHPICCHALNHTLACLGSTISGQSLAGHAEFPDACADIESSVQPSPSVSEHFALFFPLGYVA